MSEPSEASPDMSEKKDTVAHHDDHVLSEYKAQSSSDEGPSELQDVFSAGHKSHPPADNNQTSLFDHARWPSQYEHPGPRSRPLATGSHHVFENQLPYTVESAESRDHQSISRFATSTSPQNVHGKRKRENESDDSAQTSIMTPAPYATPPAFFTSTMLRDMLHAPSSVPQDMYRPDLLETLRYHGNPHAVSASSPHTPPSGSTSSLNPARYASTASPVTSRERFRSSLREAVSNFRLDIFRGPGEIRDPFRQLDFVRDLYSLDKQHLYFLTVGDRLKAVQRGFNSSADVYKERMTRPNIDTIDINLAWIPPPRNDHATLGFPWQPVCGPAAYIGLVRGDLEAKFEPEEDFYFHGQVVEHPLQIPMLNYIKHVLWYETQHCQTSYAHRHAYSGEEDDLSFMPSQAGWTPDNLPPSTAMLEPFKAGKDEVKSLVTRTGEIVKDRNGHPLRAFDHILPAKIPQSVEGWLIATWLAEDPRIQWKDIEARMITNDDKASVRIRERYAKYREGVGALSRDVNANSKRGPFKKDVRLVQQQSWEKLAANSWWSVDLGLMRICQSADLLKAYHDGKAVYHMPLSRTQNGECSSRVQAAHQAPQIKAEADAEEVDQLEQQS